jgi:hypothetical protein
LLAARVYRPLETPLQQDSSFWFNTSRTGA